MDNTRQTNLDALEELANDHIKKNKSDLKKLCEQLKPDESKHLQVISVGTEKN